MVLGPLIMVVWLAVLIAIVIGVVRWLGGVGGDAGRPSRTARQLLGVLCALAVCRWLLVERRPVAVRCQLIDQLR